MDLEAMEDLAEPVVQVDLEDTEVTADLAEPGVQVEVVVTVSSETKDTETLETLETQEEPVTQEHLVMVEKRN